MDNMIKRKVAAIMAAGVFFTTAGYSISQYQKNDKNTDKNIASSYQDDEKSEYEEYLKECDAFRRKYLIDNCIENSFGPFNYFGLPIGTSVKGHGLFDENEIYIGNNTLDFELLNDIYQRGETKEIKEEYTSKWLDISNSGQNVDFGHTINIDKGLIFPLPGGVDIVMYSRCNSDSYSVSFERRIDGISDYIRYLTFEPNQDDELILTEDRVISRYNNGMQTAYSVTEYFDLITTELPDGSITKQWKKSGDIYLRHETGKYTIYGSLNVSSLPDNSFEIISNFDAETGIGQYENTFVIVDGTCFEDIEALIIAGDFEAAAKGFQNIIMSKKAKPLVIKPQK